MNGENGTLKIPTPGRMVMYYEGGGKWPAMVVRCDDIGLSNLVVFMDNIISPVQAMLGVPHATKAGESNFCWDWPEIK